MPDLKPDERYHVVEPTCTRNGPVFSQRSEPEKMLYRGSGLRWDLTLSKDLFEGVNVIFDYED